MVCPAHMLMTSYDLFNTFGRSEKAVIPHAQIPQQYIDFMPLFRFCPAHLPQLPLAATLPHPCILSLWSICQASRCCPPIPTILPGVLVEMSCLPTY